jgi:intron-binding protein aquarius
VAIYPAPGLLDFAVSVKRKCWYVKAKLGTLLAYVLTVVVDDTLYCERFAEFISDLQSQLPTRRYVNALVKDLHLVPAMKLSPMYNDEENSLLRDLHALLVHYTYFTIDDQTGVQLSRDEAYDAHCIRLGQLQRVALKHFKEKLAVLALSNYSSIDKRDDLEGLLESLTDSEVLHLFKLLDLRSDYPESLGLPLNRKFLMEVLVYNFERKKTFQEQAQDMVLVPTEQTLFDHNFQRADAYDGSHPLALPKLNLQYLSVGDFLWRALVLYRRESFYGIRKDIDSAIRRLRPESKRPGETHFAGFSKMALPVSGAA